MPLFLPHDLCRTADYLGRRYAMSVECIVFMVGVIIQITAFTSWQQFAVGRLVSGLGVGSLSAAVPMYQAETAPPQIRGTLTATYQYVFCLMSWRHVALTRTCCAGSSLRLVSSLPVCRFHRASKCPPDHGVPQTVSPSEHVTSRAPARGAQWSALVSCGPSFSALVSSSCPRVPGKLYFHMLAYSH